MKAAIDQDICEGCGVCMPTCPEGAIQRRDGDIVIIRIFCRGCGYCVDSCPIGAISVREDD